ncbi:DUF3261 domain-containing protein [Bordetella genomosp. 13]|uniref:DUF3261 domain-containing protein n=1 Tax=Bordetella genomosp. 13 TaxID=463040 RepID=UPI0021B5F75D|nr:DUF3261 domain-containing protein [Bordetella genomosp. 13]
MTSLPPRPAVLASPAHSSPAARRRGAARAAFAAALATTLAAALTGCASAPPVPVASADLALPRFVRITTQAPGEHAQDSLLAVQAEAGQATRWSLFDLLGMPQARQILQDGTWRNDGFLPPNGRASNLFSAILFAWTPAARLEAAYPGRAWRDDAQPGGGRVRTLADDCETRWTVAWAPGAPPDTFTIRQPDGTSWRVSPVPQTP